MITFRHSATADVDAMDKIIKDAVRGLGAQGIPQWQKGYPNRELLVADIENGIGYVLTDQDRVVALCAVTFCRRAGLSSYFQRELADRR